MAQYNAIDWAIQIAHAMQFLADSKIIHGELKSPNVLLFGESMDASNGNKKKKKIKRDSEFFVFYFFEVVI